MHYDKELSDHRRNSGNQSNLAERALNTPFDKRAIYCVRGVKI